MARPQCGQARSAFSQKKKCQRGRERHGTKNDPKNYKIDLKWVARNDLDVSTTSPGTESRRGSDGHSPGVISGTSFYVIFSRYMSRILRQNSKNWFPEGRAPWIPRGFRPTKLGGVPPNCARASYNAPGPQGGPGAPKGPKIPPSGAPGAQKAPGPPPGPWSPMGPYGPTVSP